MLRRSRAVPAGILLCAVVVLHAAADVDVAVGRRLIDAALIGRSYEYARGLTEDVGARLTGSESYEQAARWAVDRFREAGVPAVRLEPFALQRSWRRERPGLG